jgi:hypothetical protein
MGEEWKTALLALIPKRWGERINTNRRDAVTHENGRRTDKRSMAGFYPA